MQKIIKTFKKIGINRTSIGALALASPFLILAMIGSAPLMPYLVIGLAIFLTFSQKKANRKTNHNNIL